MSDSNTSLFHYNLPVGVALFSAELVLLRHNVAWQTLVQSDDPASLNGTPLIHQLPTAAEVLIPLLETAQRDGEIEVQGVRVIVDQDILFWDITIKQLAGQSAAPDLMLIVNDVTERTLTNQLLERRIADRTRKLSALYDVMEVAAEPLPFKDILQESLRRVLSAVHASSGAIQIFDEAGEKLYLAAHVGLDDEVLDRIDVTAGDAGLSGWTAENDETLVLTDLNKDSRSSRVLRESDLTVYVGVPMNARGHIVGVLNAFRESRRPFSQEDISLLTSVGDQIAVAVENAKLRLENERLLLVEERNRLARELHDAVTQSLYSLVLFSGATRKQISQGKLERAETLMERVEQTGQQALKEMRLLVHNLRPDALERAGLEQAIRQRLDAVEGRANIKSRFLVDGIIELPPHVEEALYQLTQEALNNSLKHSSASLVTVELAQTAHAVSLSITDDGVGFKLAEATESGGLGLTSMRERIELLNGDLTITSQPQAGTTVNVQIQLQTVGEPIETLEIIDLI